MLVEIGPTSAGLASAWLAHARTVVEDARTAPNLLGFDIPSEALDAFERHVDAWQSSVRAPDPFRWSGDVPVDAGVFVAVVLLRMADRLDAHDEGDAFFREVVAAFLTAMDAAGRVLSELSAHLRLVWPAQAPAPAAATATD